MSFRFLASLLVAAATAPILALPSADPKLGEAPSTSVPKEFLAGYDAGLYRIEEDRITPLWLDGEVRKIIKCSKGWYLLTSRGVVFSADLGVFEDRSSGLPIKTYKRFEGGRKSFSTETQDLKDLEVDQSDPLVLATCTKDAVYASKDGGLSWQSYGSPVAITGLKATGLAPYPGTGESAIWASHPIKGLFAKRLSGKTGWAPVNSGLATIIGTTSVEEIADLVPGANGTVWASDSFLPRIYRMDAKGKAFATVWSERSDFGCAESLEPLPDGSLRFVADGYVARLDPAKGAVEQDAKAQAIVRAAVREKPDWQLFCLSWAEAETEASLSELWLVAFHDGKPYRARAENHQALYLQTGYIVNPAPRAKYDELMSDRRLDAVVVDMKDDFGRLRFEPRDPEIRTIGKSANPLDVETFVKEWKAKGRYLIARIPVFKDEVAYKYGGGKYAVWDSSSLSPWRGYNLAAKKPDAGSPSPQTALEASPQAPPSFDVEPAAPEQAQSKPSGTEKVLIGEYWVDPYCEEVWAYNIAIANEIVARGFDEVQFDYIRFPTDGANIDSASFRWKDPGMDRESALASFLRFARDNISAPISMDIYGANGWYRSGVRTGQDVELLSKYVDVICPMFYPSHFEQSFLAQAPAVERPYRIYRLGSLRNAYIARKKVVIRPYVQAFFLNVSYDRTFYNPDYVKREIAGVRDSENLGLTFWNNSGRYDDVPVLEIGPDGRLAGESSVKKPDQGILN